MHSTRYVITFIVLLCAVSAFMLATLSTTFKERHDRNEALFNKKAILKAVEGPMGRQVDDMSDEEVIDLFKTKISQLVVDMDGNEVAASEVAALGYDDGQAEDVDMKKEKKKDEEDRILPVFRFVENSDEYYIISVRGSGLWDEIWGNIALEDDFTTIAGVSFDHQAETPGLGAEIKDNPGFPAQFVGKKIYDSEGNYTSVFVRKGGAKNDDNEVDGISGATITADGVTEMLDRGIKYYEPYFEKIKN